MIAPFFWAGVTDRNTVRGYLAEEYGESLKDAPDWWLRTFLRRATNYIYVPDLPREFRKTYSVSAAAAYFNPQNLEGLYEEQEELKELREEELEELEKYARKGL